MRRWLKGCKGDLTDITLIGYSEGAATVATLLSNLADDPTFLADTNVREQLTAAFLLEVPTGTDFAVLNWDGRNMVNLPRRLADAGMGKVKLGDIWNMGSKVHLPGPILGWEAHSYPYGDIRWRDFPPDNPVAQWALTFTIHHPDVRTSPHTLETIRKVMSR
jgi:hypothetical protein